jgi:uncharacterized metal-binding protein YceD (DUF177 family)
VATESSIFKVALRDLPTHRRIVVGPEFVDGLLRGLPLRDALEGEIPEGDGGVAELDLDTTDSKSVFVQGSVTGQLAVACSRCVKPALIRFDEAIHVTFLPAAEVAPEDDPDGSAKPVTKRAERAAAAEARRAEKAEAAAAAGAKSGKGEPKGGKGKDDDDLGVELATDDLDVFPYTGDAIDLEALVREQFVLSVPYAPLCKEDCLGLCPQCGTDRNVAPCDCEKPIDPRFAALQGLKLPS